MSSEPHNENSNAFFKGPQTPLLTSNERGKKDRKASGDNGQKEFQPITSEQNIEDQINQLKTRLTQLKRQHGIFSTAGAFGVFPVIILTATFGSKLAESIKIDSLPNLEDVAIQMSLFALYGLMIYGINHFWFEKKIDECVTQIQSLEQQLRASETEKQIDKCEEKINPTIKALEDRIQKLEIAINRQNTDQEVRENKTHKDEVIPNPQGSDTFVANV